jgi:hypothetical protein
MGRMGDDAAMTAILYPVAENGDRAVAEPQGRAARERDAERLAGEDVTFVTELVGPAFASAEAALEAYAGRVDDERPGSRAVIAAEDRYCRLVETVAEGARPKAVQPAYKDGRRWPAAAPALRTVWRLEVAYWRPVSAAAAAGDRPQARRARRRRAGESLSPDVLRAMAAQPLRPVEPQQPLDIGLFEVRLPEAPHIVISDE